MIYLFIIDHGGWSPIPCSHHPHDGPLVTRSARDPLKGATDGSHTPKLDSQLCPKRPHSVLSTTLIIGGETNSTPWYKFHLRQQPLRFLRRVGVPPMAYLIHPNCQNSTTSCADGSHCILPLSLYYTKNNQSWKSTFSPPADCSVVYRLQFSLLPK